MHAKNARTPEVMKKLAGCFSFAFLESFASQLLYQFVCCTSAVLQFLAVTELIAATKGV